MASNSKFKDANDFGSKSSKTSESNNKTETSQPKSGSKASMSKQLTEHLSKSTTSTNSEESKSNESIEKAPSKSRNAKAEVSKSTNVQKPKKTAPKSQYQVAMAGAPPQSSSSIKKFKHRRSVKSKHKKSTARKGTRKKHSHKKSSKSRAKSSQNGHETDHSEGGGKRKSSSVIDKVKIVGKLPTSEDFDGTEEYSFSGPLYFISQFFALIIMILLTCWLIEYYEAPESHSFITAHPLIMIFILIYVLANSLLFLNAKKTLQTSRLIIFATIFVFTMVGLGITILWHFTQKLSHLQSLHSWIGVITLIILIIYLLYAYNVYFRTDFRQGVQQIYYLRLLGICALIMSGATCLLGITELLMMKMFIGPTAQFKFVSHKNDNTPVPNMLANIIGLFMICYILSMIYLLTTTNYKPKKQIKREQIERQIRTSLHRAMAQLQQQ